MPQYSSLSRLCFKISISLCLCLATGISAKSEKLVTLKCRDAGMFSVCNDVLSLLNCYENKIYKGIHVNFRQSGLYYDSEYGSNWWNYYFSPIRYGFKHKHRYVHIHVDGEHLPGAMQREALRAFDRNTAHRIIKNHIHIKPAIMKKIDNFAAEHFKDTFIFGIHYRGTDKITEAPRVPYRKVFKQIQQTIADFNPPDYKIFIATDEQTFLNYMQSLFPNKTCCYTPALRSQNNQPIHLNYDDLHYKRGEDAVIDCLLLSKTNCLIRTSSNLSLWSTYFNPHLPVIDLNMRYEP